MHIYFIHRGLSLSLSPPLVPRSSGILSAQFVRQATGLRHPTKEKQLKTWKTREGPKEISLSFVEKKGRRDKRLEQILNFVLYSFSFSFFKFWVAGRVCVVSSDSPVRASVCGVASYFFFFPSFYLPGTAHPALTQLKAFSSNKPGRGSIIKNKFLHTHWRSKDKRVQTRQIKPATFFLMWFLCLSLSCMREEIRK